MQHILVIPGVIVAIILIALGLFMMLRRPKAPATLESAEPVATATAFVEESPSESTSAVPTEPVISANQFITQTIHQQVIDHPADEGKPTAPSHEDALEMAAVTAQDFDDLPVLDHEVTEPVAAPEKGELDALLDDLEQATLQPTDRITPSIDGGETVAVMPELTAIETAKLADWEGDSILIDEHLAEHCRSEEDSILVQAEHIIAISLLPKSGRPLEGRKVLEALRKHGLRFGEMSLFHRYEESSGQGALMFSVLKFTKDGPVGFDLDTMDQENMEGLSFFLALPGIRPLQGFDMMISTAQRLSIDFYAQLFDEEMNLFSEQLKSHYRHQVLDFRPSVLR
jgi:cell division protein ZipA